MTWDQPCEVIDRGPACTGLSPQTGYPLDAPLAGNQAPKRVPGGGLSLPGGRKIRILGWLALRREKPGPRGKDKRG